jgi:hypothetical protein
MHVRPPETRAPDETGGYGSDLLLVKKDPISSISVTVYLVVIIRKIHNGEFSVAVESK